jgi:hypothetical protein
MRAAWVIGAAGWIASLRSQCREKMIGQNLEQVVQ